MELGLTVEELAARTDTAPWIVARSLANLIEKGLVRVVDGTAEEAVASLRATPTHPATGDE